ncbi:MAG: tetratricopeptide repeat protein [Ignavibacteria bacterium]|nr:tetratricopeptide repeat protein [Ignavibacteria bacterium]
MEFWSYDDDEYFDDEDDGENQPPIDKSYIRSFDKWHDSKKSSGSDFSIEDLNEIERVLEYCIENGYFKSALKYCDTLLEYNPISNELLAMRGYILLNLKDFPNAISSLQQALLINPNDTEALMNLSLTYYNSGDYEKSLKTLDKLLSIEPSDYALYNKGIILQSYQKYDEALDIFKTLLNSDEYRSEALQEISHILFLQGKFEESLEINIQAIETEPNDYWLWFNLGLCYLELGRFYKAIDAFKNSISIYPGFEYSYLYLGWAYSNLGRYKQAIHSFLQYCGGNYDKYVYFEIANLLGDLGFYKPAIRFYKEIVDKEFTFAPAHIGLALCYKYLGNDRLAEEHFKLGVSLDPKNSEFWLMAIKFLIEIKKIGKAFSMFSNALMNNPKNEELLLNFHIYVFKYKRFTEGIEILENLKPLVPNNPTILFYLGEFYARMGQMNKAIEYFSESINMNQSFYQRLKSVLHLIVKKKDFSHFEKMLNLKLSAQEIKFNKT